MKEIEDSTQWRADLEKRSSNTTPSLPDTNNTFDEAKLLFSEHDEQSPPLSEQPIGDDAIDFWNHPLTRKNYARIFRPRHELGNGALADVIEIDFATKKRLS